MLVPVHRGVFRHVAFPPQWPQTVLAAVLAAGEGAVASHLSAAALWRVDGVVPGPIEVTVSRERRPHVAGAVIHRSRDLGVADIDRHHLIPRTAPARTLLDIAPRLTSAELERALDGMERTGLIWRPHLRWRLAELRRHGRAGVRAVEALLDRTEGRPLGESWLEQEALRLVVGAGLPTPQCQVRLRPGGRRIARVDLAWPEHKLIVEIDGHGSHATRRQRQADAERDARLGLAGWTVVRFTYEDVTERPRYVIEMIRRHLRRQG